MGASHTRTATWTVVLLKIRHKMNNYGRALAKFWRQIFDIEAACAFYSHCVTTLPNIGNSVKGVK